MDPDRNALAQSYGDKSNNELLELHATGALTNTAYDVLEIELANRGIPFPTRPAEDNKINNDADDNKLNGLGGWLILVGINVVITPIVFLVVLLQFDQKTWDPVLIGVIIYVGVAFVASCILVYLFFSKHQLFPKVYLGFLSVFFVVIPLTAWLVISLISEESFFNLEVTQVIGGKIIFVAIWGSYILQSKRVKKTFIN